MRFEKRIGELVSKKYTERQIRPSVVIRKITYGSSRGRGICILMSVQQACKIRRQNFHDYALSYLAEFASKR
ncbi:MAG: hypothetical protein QW177_09655 [Candidatus Nitrosotenuis sp.]